MISRWRFGIFLVIALFIFLLIVRWQDQPLFLDSYYHAACMAGFKDAGGIVLHDFWEYAPAGRPHLYPPVFHIILLGLSKLGLPALFILRLVSAAAYPIFLFVISWVVARLYDDKRAFFTVLAASMPYTFFLNAMIAIPSTLALMLFILLFYALETRKVLCGALLLGLAFYTHAAIPWIAIATLVFYALLRRAYLKHVFSIALGGLILAGPWLFYVSGKRDYLVAVSSYINGYFEANILFYLFAAAGIIMVFRHKGRSLFYLAMAAGMIPMVKDYSFRFLCAEGLLPIIFLAGIGLDEIYSRLCAFMIGRRAKEIVYSVLLPWLIFFLVVFWPKSSVDRFTNYDGRKGTALELSIYFRKGMEELFDIINANSRRDDIVFCNYSHVGGIFYVFTGRASSVGMLNEVKPIYNSDPAIPAALVIWIKNPEGLFEPQLSALIDRLGLIKIKETEFAYIYRNPVIMAHKQIARPVIPASWALLILFIWVSAVFVCITRPNRI